MSLRISLINYLRKAKLERDRATVSPFLGYLAGKSQQQKTGQAVLAGSRVRSLESKGDAESQQLKSKFIDTVASRAARLI